MALIACRGSTLALVAWAVLVVLPQEARAEVELSVLSYNVRGISWLLARDEPRRRNREIGALLGSYEVVLLQEDFEYSARLVDGLEHAVVHGNGMRVDPRLLGLQLAFLPLLVLVPDFSAPYGAGLTIAVDLPAVRGSLLRQSYTRCAGWLGGRFDCWASKGFLRLRVRPSLGLELDLYTTHLDSGGTEADRAARAAQLDELAAAIERDSAGRAVLVGGDLNLLADRPEDLDLLHAFRRRLGLRDTGAGPQHRDWRRVDYLLVRNGDGARIRVLEAGEDPRFVRGGVPLSDHPAIFARLGMERSTGRVHSESARR